MSWHHHTFRFTRGPSGSDEIPDKDADHELSVVLNSKNNELAVAFYWFGNRFQDVCPVFRDAARATLIYSGQHVFGLLC